MSHCIRAARRPLPALAALALAAAACAAQAQSLNKLDTVVTTATRTPQKLADVLADLTVITRADIERQAVSSFADLLRNNGCAELVRNGGPGANTTLFLRGADSRHTLVLIDGVQVDSQSTGGASWNAIPLAQIERVEILKGPASAVYGSAAVGGVVQIFTRKGTSTPSLDLGIAAGNLGTQKADASIAGLSGLFDYAASLSAERSDGFDAKLPTASSPNADRDGYRKQSGSLRLGAKLNDQHRVDLTALRSHVNAQYDGSKAPIDDHAIQDTDAARVSLSSQWAPALNTQLSVGESRDRYETRPSPYLTITHIRNVALTGGWQAAPGHQLNFVAEHSEDKLENSGLTSADHKDKRSQNGVGLGYLFSHGPINLQAQARHDRDSQFGGVDTGTLLAGYQFAPGWRVVGSAGNSFRAPTLYQRGSIYGPDLSKPGVAPLDAEHGHNLEFGLKFDSGSSSASATAYRNRVSNLIIFGAAGSCNSSFGCYQNVSRAILQGLSLAGETQAGVVRLQATLDLQAPKDAATGLRLARRAKQLATVRAETELAGWQLGAGVQTQGKRFDDAANKKPLGAYALLNLDAAYKLTPELKLQLNLANVTDHAYQTAGGYASDPRTVMLGLRYTPKL